MITYSILSQCGDREYNEDCIHVMHNKDTYCFALADGLGGQGNGKVASQTVINFIEQLFEKNGENEDFISQAFLESQQCILEKKQSQNYGDMMTTLVVLSIGQQIQWGHIGDSRLYYFQDQKLVSQTLDHSVPQVLAFINEIEPWEIRHHPDRNRLLKAMGKVWEHGMEYALSDPICRNNFQAFLLCSDGFWEHIEEIDMERTLSQADSVSTWLEEMKKIVVNNGETYEMDNYSAIAVWLTKD